MTKISDTFAWDEWCSFTDEDTDNILKFYAHGGVPSYDELMALRRDGGFGKVDVFDGSYGFSVGI